MREACNTGPPDVPQKGSPPAANQGRRNRRKILTRTVSVRSRRVKRPELIARSRTPEAPYCWQSKGALRRIREQLDGDNLLPYALAVYSALTENASDKGAEEFSTLQSRLARLAGDISTRTVQRVLPLLRDIGVIDYTTPRLRGPITFRLLSVTPNSPNDTTNSRNVTTGAKTASSRTIEVTKKDANRERFDAESVQLPFQSEKFSQAWSTWLRHRKEIGHPLTPTAMSRQLSKLKAMGEARAIATIEHSVANGWQGLFEPKPATNEKPLCDPLGRPLNGAAQRQGINASPAPTLERLVGKPTPCSL